MYLLKPLKTSTCGLFLLTLLIASHIADAQHEQSMALPIFANYDQSLSFLNPAFTNNQRLSGFTGVRLYGNGIDKNYLAYTDVNYKITKDKKHSIGLTLLSDIEGVFLSRNWLHFRYQFEIQLSEKLKLSSGLNFGWVNYLVKHSDVSPGGSDTGADLNVGVRLIANRFSIGGTINQITEARISPIEQAFVLQRYWSVHGLFTVLESLNYKLRSGLMSRNINTRRFERALDHYAIAELLLGEHLSGGVNYNWVDNLTSVYIGFNGINVGELIGGFRISYGLPNVNLQSGQFELTLLLGHEGISN